jgi:hypothetical protein
MFHSLSRLSFVALAAVLAAAAPASAQEQPSEFQSWTIPGWTFTPGMVFGTLFDSNVAIAGRDVNGKTASDSLLQMEPFGQLEFRSPRTTFSGGYRGSLRRYFDLTGLNGADHRAYVNWRDRLTRRVILFATEDYQQVATTDRLVLNDLPFERLGARHNSVVAGVEARVTKGMDLAVRYENGWIHFEPAVPGDVRTGGIVQGVRSDLTHRASERLSFGGTYDVRRSNLNQGTRQQTFQEAGGGGGRRTLAAAGPLARHQPDGIVPARQRAAPHGAGDRRRGIQPRLQAVVRVRRADEQRRSLRLRAHAALEEPRLRRGVGGVAPLASDRPDRPGTAVVVDEHGGRLRAAALAQARRLLVILAPGHTAAGRTDRPASGRRTDRDL